MIGPGVVVLIVGPSGAGKDAIIREVRSRLAGNHRYVFPRRIITRTANAAEDHLTVTDAQFKAQLQQGAFALHWEAHGLHYGIPAEIDDRVRDGSSVIFNASRYILPLVRGRYANTATVLIDAPPAVRAQRLVLRDREQPEEIAIRLARAVAGVGDTEADLVIDNGGLLLDATTTLVDWLLRRELNSMPLRAWTQ